MIKLFTLLKSFLLFTVICFATPLVVFGQTTDEEIERQRIANNNIRKSYQWNHRYTQGKPNPNGFKAIETTYDRNGNPIEIINFRANGDTSSRIVYKYNANNLRTEYLLYQKGDRAFIYLSYKQTINYNDKGLRNLEVIFDGISSHRIRHLYYPDDRIKETAKIAPGNVIEEKWDYTYDNSTQTIKVYIPEGVHSHTLTRKFDRNNNMVSEVRTNPSGQEVRKLTYAFDNNGRRAEEVEYNMGNLTRKHFFKYTAKGNLIEIIQELPNGTRFTQSEFSYDSMGNLIEERWTERDSSPFSHRKTSYDDGGTVKEHDSFFAPYNFQVLYRYTYDYF